MAGRVLANLALHEGPEVLVDDLGQREDREDQEGDLVDLGDQVHLGGQAVLAEDFGEHEERADLKRNLKN